MRLYLFCIFTRHVFIFQSAHAVDINVHVCECSSGMSGNVQWTPASLVTSVRHVISWNLTRAPQSQTHLNSSARRAKSVSERQWEKRGGRRKRRELSIPPRCRWSDTVLFAFVCLLLPLAATYLTGAMTTTGTTHHPVHFQVIQIFLSPAVPYTFNSRKEGKTWLFSYHSNSLDINRNDTT